jgi:hypothetical protein
MGKLIAHPDPSTQPPPPHSEKYATLCSFVHCFMGPFSNLCDDMVSRIDLSKGGGPSLGRGDGAGRGAIWDNILLII